MPCMPNTGVWVDPGASYGNQGTQGQMMGGNVFQGQAPGNQGQLGGNQGQVGGIQGQVGGPVSQMPPCNYGPQGSGGFWAELVLLE